MTQEKVLAGWIPGIVLEEVWMDNSMGNQITLSFALVRDSSKGTCWAIKYPCNRHKLHVYLRQANYADPKKEGQLVVVGLTKQ